MPTDLDNQKKKPVGIINSIVSNTSRYILKFLVCFILIYIHLFGFLKVMILGLLVKTEVQHNIFRRIFVVLIMTLKIPRNRIIMISNYLVKVHCQKLQMSANFLFLNIRMKIYRILWGDHNSLCNLSITVFYYIKKLKLSRVMNRIYIKLSTSSNLQRKNIAI